MTPPRAFGCGDILRRTAGALFACLALMLPGPGALAQALDGARYAEPTARYDHAILGDALEWGALILRPSGAGDIVIRLPQTRVFEDTAPRIVDLGAGRQAALVVETDLRLGARIALYDGDGLVAAGPFIGQAHRWLAPLGAADLDGDGQLEIAYVDRPHLARILRVWRYVPGQIALSEVAQGAGLTNHRIGWDYIAGGLRDCGAGAEMITADSAWSSIVSSRVTGAGIKSRRLGRYDADRMTAAMACSPGTR